MTLGAERGEIAEIGSPVVLPPAAVDRRRPWRWTTTSIVVAALLLALVQGPAMADWADDLPPGPVAAALQPHAHAWADLTTRAHLDAPAAWLRQHWKAAQGARFGAEEPGEAGATAAP
ncbi:hypothetical protein [Sphingomonas elodea]|uniref:hypothetical protein n=1 Tax=Sphingomonas elodea TaxID=179878 RepID=UPI0002630AA3|nr:hypothetical protein [Sphingomonas elodea]